MSAEPQELAEQAEHGHESGLAAVTITMAVLAVFVAAVSLMGHRMHTEELLLQTKATDQWAYYQAKSIREHLYKSQKLMLENELDLLSQTLSTESAEKVKASIETLARQESKFANDKKEIEQEARKLEKERDINRSRDPYFEYGEVLLQIAIVMASVSIIAASRAVFGFSIAAALLGAVMCANGYLQIFALPFLH